VISLNDGKNIKSIHKNVLTLAENKNIFSVFFLDINENTLEVSSGVATTIAPRLGNSIEAKKK